MKFNSLFLKLRQQISKRNQKPDFAFAYAYNQAGCASMMARDSAKGCELFKEALSIWHEIPEYRPGLASMEVANLGLSYWLLGDLAKASQVLEEGLREREEGFGKDDSESFRYAVDLNFARVLDQTNVLTRSRIHKARADSPRPRQRESEPGALGRERGTAPKSAEDLSSSRRKQIPSYWRYVS